MSRAIILLVIVGVLLVAGLVLLSRKGAEVPVHTIEAPVTAANGA